MQRYLIIICFLCLFISCQKEVITETKEIELPSFQEVVAEDALDISFEQGAGFGAAVTGDPEFIEQIAFEVEDGILHIRNERKIKWMSPRRNEIKLRLIHEALNKITAAEGCQLRTSGPMQTTELGLILKGKSNFADLELDVQTFYYWNHFPAGGKLILSGKTDTLKLWNVAIFSVDAKELSAKHGFVENSSKGDCEIYISESLEYGIYGTGDIHLYGDPATIKTLGKSSTGELIIH